ncbi:MAG: TetR/AcrR family transcriptional regulator [Cellulosilyticaceae bacterium]
MARNKYPEETVKLILDEALNLFTEKGYENTSIQDIINNLGGLSKGAIYHHFKSKEEIFEAVCRKIGDANAIYYAKIRDDQTLTGYEKLKIMIESGYSNPNSKAIMSMTAKIMNDPKFVMNQILEIFELVVPQYIQPIIEQGICDGSIQTNYPKELAEVIIVLINIWINPVIAKTTAEGMHRKLNFLNQLLNGIGLNLLDEKTITQYVAYCTLYSQ